MKKTIIQKVFAILVGTIVGTAVGTTLEYCVDKYLLHHEVNLFDGIVRAFCVMLVTAIFVAVFVPRWISPKKNN